MKTTGNENVSPVSHVLMNKIAAMVLSLCICLVVPIEGHASSFSPNQVKAAMLIKLTDFITWPEESFRTSQERFIIGVLGEHPIFDLLSSIKDRKIQGRRLSVVRITKWYDGPDLHLLYMAPNSLDQWKKRIRTAKNKNVLTVSESDDFLRAGGILSFTPKKNGRIGFTINRTAQRGSGLIFSSALLKVAEIRTYGDMP